jgi:hypothetical protein
MDKQYEDTYESVEGELGDVLALASKKSTAAFKKLRKVCKTLLYTDSANLDETSKKLLKSALTSSNRARVSALESKRKLKKLRKSKNMRQMEIVNELLASKDVLLEAPSDMLVHPFHVLVNKKQQDELNIRFQELSASKGKKGKKAKAKAKAKAIIKK